MEAHILSYGGIVQKLKVPDANGVLRDVALGFDQLEPYEVAAGFYPLRINHTTFSSQPVHVQNGTSPYFGAVVGRVANRIANSTFELDGKTYHVIPNENSTSLHGGLFGFSRHVWEGQTFTNASGTGVRLQYDSPDGDEVS